MKIKDRLKKLFALADDPSASKGEIENAMRVARKLMVEHGLSRSDLKDSEFTKRAIDHIGKNLSTWESAALSIVVNLIGYVQAYRSGRQVIIFGPERDVDTAAEAYILLRDTIKATAMLLYDSWYRGDGAMYAQGFVVGLQEAQTKSTETLVSSEHALMVQDSRQQAKVKGQATRWLKREDGVTIRRGSRRTGARSGSRAAFHEGRQDGRNHSV